MTDNNVTKLNPKKDIKLILNQREVNIALNELWLKHYEVSLPNDLDYLNATCDKINLSEDDRNDLIISSKSNVLPDESISWLQNDLRAALWFDFYLYSKRDLNFPWRDFSADFLKNLIINFDLQNYSSTNRDGSQYNHYNIEWKRDFMNEAKSLYIKVRTTLQDLEWLNEKNEKQILWAHSYLSTHGYLVQNPLFLCNDLSAYYMQICASLDALDIPNRRNSRPYKMTLFKKDVLNKMRNAWSQKKFRDKKDAETAQEYFLTRRHMNKLKKLADGYGLSSKEYLQQLIDEAYNSID